MPMYQHLLKYFLGSMEIYHKKNKITIKRVKTNIKRNKHNVHRKIKLTIVTTVMTVVSREKLV